MSRIREALNLKTQDERMAWFLSLAPEERSEVRAEVDEAIGLFSDAMKRITGSITEWTKAAEPIFGDAAAKLRAFSESVDLDVTRQVQIGIVDGDTASINRCVCGRAVLFPAMILFDRRRSAQACPMCGRRLYFRSEVRVFQVVDSTDEQEKN